MTLLPDDEGLDLIHTRQYETRVYQTADDEMLVRGVVSDVKPPGLYVDDDPEPMEMHQMQLELKVRLPKLEIIEAKVLFETHPHSKCPMIAADYQKLVGLSIARGFTHEIRHLFGGPKGCTHTNALLQAMAPAVVQATWSVAVRRGLMNGKGRAALSPEERSQRMAGNLNTCHIWAEDGEHVRAIRSGESTENRPIPVLERLQELGLEEADRG
jgi:hypothetical protein